MKTGLCMEGGAMRGMFTCGVIDVFLENGVIFDCASGISAGAAIGCNFKSKQQGRGIRYNKKYGRDKRYKSIYSLLTTGDLYGAEFCYRTIPRELDIFDEKAYMENPMDFFVGATNVDTGETEYRNLLDGDDKDIEWMRASASMPIVSRVVEIDGRGYLDGGITDAIPYDILEKNGCDRIVCILTQPADYIKKKTRMMFISRIFLGKYPKMIEALSTRHIRYNEQTKRIKKLEEEGKIFVIRPENDLGIKRTESDPDELERVYQTGRQEAENRLKDMKIYLKQ